MKMFASVARRMTIDMAYAQPRENLSPPIQFSFNRSRDAETDRIKLILLYGGLRENISVH